MSKEPIDESGEDEEAPAARGIEAMDVETQIGEKGGPQVDGVSPDLIEKDPSDVSMEDLKGLSDDEKDEVLSIMAARDRENSEDTEVTEDSNESEGEATEATSETTTSSESESDSNGEKDDSGPDPATLHETGLVDEENEFPWEGEAISETDVGKGGIIEKFRYKRTNFEVREPENRQKFEQSFQSLAEAQEMQDQGKIRSITEKYSRDVAEQSLTVDGHDIKYVYKVEHGDTSYVVPDEDGEKGLDHHEEAEQIWDAMTWFDRFKVGMKVGEDVMGEGQFQQRLD